MAGDSALGRHTRFRHGTHEVRTQGHSNGDELREASRRRVTPGRSLTPRLDKISFSRHASHQPRAQDGLITPAKPFMQRSSVGEGWVVFSWACRGAEGLRVVTPVHVDPRSSDSDSFSTAAAPVRNY